MNPTAPPPPAFRSLAPSFLTVCPSGADHWPDAQNALFTLEATGYALLALLKLGRMQEAELAFKFLNSRRGRGGGFGSTQVNTPPF